MSGREIIFVAVPSLPRRITIELAELAVRSQGPRCQWEISWHFLGSVSPLAFARNRLVDEFLKSNADRLWFLDDDVMPPGNAPDLLRVEGDIVSAAVPIYRKSETGYDGETFMNAWRVNGSGMIGAPERSGGPVDVDAVGFASTVIRRRVFEDERMRFPPRAPELPYFGGVRVSAGFPALFRSPATADEAWVTDQDIDFCLRARSLGYCVRFVPSIVFGHRKDMDLRRFLDAAAK